eukprot:127898-Prymnesium_polylepis.2
MARRAGMQQRLHTRWRCSGRGCCSAYIPYQDTYHIRGSPAAQLCPAVTGAASPRRRASAPARQRIGALRRPLRRCCGLRKRGARPHQTWSPTR